MTCTGYCDGCGDITTVRLFGKSLYCGQCAPKCIECGKIGTVAGYETCADCTVTQLMQELPDGDGTDAETDAIRKEIFEIRRMAA